MNAASPILVVLDRPDDGVDDSTAALVARAERLAEAMSTSVVVAAIGPKHAGSWASPNIGAPETTVHLVEHPSLDDGDAGVVAHAARHLLHEIGAGIVLLHDDASSRAVAGYLAVVLDAPVLTRCTEIEASASQLHITRRAYDGAVLEHLELDAPRAIITVETAAVEDQRRAASTEVRRSDGGLEGFRSRMTVTLTPAPAGPSLRNARRIVAVGGGIQEVDDFHAIEQLAKALDAVVAGSKPTVSRGWVGPQGKVGLTGTTVTPDVYLALGISGASQHMAGCKRAAMLIAINCDRRAPIFRYARLGVVGDANEIVRALLDELGASDR